MLYLSRMYIGKRTSCCFKKIDIGLYIDRTGMIQYNTIQICIAPYDSQVL